MHNTWVELVLVLNDSGVTHFCVALTARSGASYDLTIAALGKNVKKQQEVSDLNRDHPQTVMGNINSHCDVWYATSFTAFQGNTDEYRYNAVFYNMVLHTPL